MTDVDNGRGYARVGLGHNEESVSPFQFCKYKTLKKTKS